MCLCLNTQTFSVFDFYQLDSFLKRFSVAMMPYAAGLLRSMATTFTSVCSIASTSQSVDKKFINSSETLSSFSGISLTSFGGRGKNKALKKRYDSKIKSMAKELHFNQDGSAIKKLQVSLIGILN